MYNTLRRPPVQECLGRGGGKLVPLKLDLTLAAVFMPQWRGGLLQGVWGAVLTLSKDKKLAGQSEIRDIQAQITSLGFFVEPRHKQDLLRRAGPGMVGWQ